MQLDSYLKLAKNSQRSKAEFESYLKTCLKFAYKKGNLKDVSLFKIYLYKLKRI